MISAKKKIKILFRHRSMEMGGVEKVMLMVMENLDPDKFESTVCLNLNQGELRDAFPPHVRKIYLAQGKEDMSRNPLWQKIQLWRRRKRLAFLSENTGVIDTEILKDKFDIEIGMTYNDFESVLNSSNKTSKKVGWFHSEIHLPKLQPLVPKILEHFPLFDQIIYCSEKIKGLLHEHYPLLAYPREDVVINAVPIEEIKTNSQVKITDLPPSPVFVSVGRLHSRKGYHKLLDAHAKLLKEGFSHSVLVIGDGEELPDLLKQQKELEVQKTFIFAGNKMNPYPYIKNADFFILPSESEAWPLVIAEALILQKPIIATKTGDIPEMIAHKKTGYLIDYSTEEIYEAMKVFLTDAGLITSIKENLINIEEQFDNRKIFDKLEEILLHLVS